MPVLGNPPTQMGHAVILANDTTYVQATLINTDSMSVTLQVPNVCAAGPYRVFPLYPEQDGLYELQGILASQEGDVLLLKL